MSQVTYSVYRGSADKKPIQDTLTSTLGPTDVFVKITHSGVCGTDEHCANAPVALGHEGVGIVGQVGSNVTSFKTGDRVGFGYVKKSCGDCVMCLTARDQYCSQVQLYSYGSTDTGSFSSGAVCDQSSLVHIPEGIDSANAAPLMCAGATVWEVLTKPTVKITDRVGVVGMGGLGHLAIKIASKMGLEVVVLSGSDSKREEALTFGAKEFHVLRSGEPTPEGIAPLNHLLLCGSGKVNHDQLVSLMGANGIIYTLTVDMTPSPITLLWLNAKAVSIQGSLVSSRVGMRNMLAFCNKHSIAPQIQKYALDGEGITKAMQDLRDGQVRYRAVLVAQ